MRMLQGTYFENMVRSMLFNFSNLVTINGRIENELKMGRILGTAGNQASSKKPKGNFTKNKERETNVVLENIHPQY